MSILTAGIPAKLSRVRLGRHASGKDLRCFLSRRRYVLICRSGIVGSICRYFGGIREPAFIWVKIAGYRYMPPASQNPYPIIVYFVADIDPIFVVILGKTDFRDPNLVYIVTFCLCIYLIKPF